MRKLEPAATAWLAGRRDPGDRRSFFRGIGAGLVGYRHSDIQRKRLARLCARKAPLPQVLAVLRGVAEPTGPVQRWGQRAQPSYAPALQEHLVGWLAVCRLAGFGLPRAQFEQAGHARDRGRSTWVLTPKRCGPADCL